MKRSHFAPVRMCSLLPLLTVFAVRGLAAEGGWISLFDGVSLAGWKAGENPASFKIVDGAIATDGPRAHLFYMGDDAASPAEFENFEFSIEAMTKPGANSGVYFHAAWIGQGWPTERGFEVQVDNSQPLQGNYIENKRTGSLYGVRNVYPRLVRDNEWFTLSIVVRKPRVEIRVNGVLVVDYVEPAEPLPVGAPKFNRLGRGTFALQAHDAQSHAFFRNIRVRPLPPTPAGSIAPPLLTAEAALLLPLAKDNFPLVDLNTHLGPAFPLERALAQSRATGIGLGVVATDAAGAPVRTDAAARAFLDRTKGQAVFFVLRPEDRSWTKVISRETRARFDTIIADARTFTPPAVGSDEQAYMDKLVAQTVEILATEPVDVYANPTFLPAALASRVDALWTEERMQKIIAAAVANDVAIEINTSRRLPSERFIRLAKTAGAKFTLGTGAIRAESVDRSYGWEMQKAAALNWRNMYEPGHKPTRAQREAGL
ncbi:MAG: family 16 glycoside hydrolase [Opitutaceae bacterium]